MAKGKMDLHHPAHDGSLRLLVIPVIRGLAS
jgi:hypothetical protein